MKFIFLYTKKLLGYNSICYNLGKAGVACSMDGQVQTVLYISGLVVHFIEESESMIKKLLAILIAGAFASVAFAAEASSPMMMSASGADVKAAASSSKHSKKHSKKHHKSHKAASAA